MATKNLTRLYFKFRDNHKTQQQRDTPKKDLFKARAKNEESISLINDEDNEDDGLGGSNFSSLPPEWTTAVEEVQYDISKIMKRMKDLSSLHNKHLNRPSMDDNMTEEHTIDVTTQEITQLFHQCQRCIQSIQGRSMGCQKAERQIIKNVVSSLASQLQDLSFNFKKDQSKYLKRMKNREEREKEYFSNDFNPTNVFMQEDENFEELYDKGFTTAQLTMVEENDKFVKQREEEISHIVQSIGDLNTIFKDLSILIVDQGTILDRIDYNVEQASVQVEKGYQQLQKAEKHQKKNRKMMCILVLSVILTIMITILVLTKS